MCSDDKAKGLSVRARSSGKEGTDRRNFRSKSKGCKFSKFCIYYRKPGHVVAECYKLKNKKERDHNHSTEAAISNSGSDNDVLLVTTMDSLGATEWALDFGRTYHMCPNSCRD